MTGIPTVLDERFRAAAAASGDLDVAYDRLNELEACPPGQRWGGSDLVGGSPRRVGCPGWRSADSASTGHRASERPSPSIGRSG